MKLYLTNGTYLEFPQAGLLQIEQTLSWFRSAPPEGVATFKAETGPVTHIQKAHIVSIEVSS